MKFAGVFWFLVFVVLPGICSAGGDYFLFDKSKNFIEAKYYPPHNEWTPQPGAAQVGVDRWAVEINLEAELFPWNGYRLFFGVNPEFHFMVDFPEEVEKYSGGDLRDITMQYYGGVRFDDWEIRFFHGREMWQPDPRQYSRWLYNGIGFRFYFGE